MSFRPPKGTDDLLAPESQAWREALSSWDDWSARFGYPLVATPILEATELFERGVGESTEVVSKQMYTFQDRGGRSVTLRPEGTAGVVRAYLNSGAQGSWKGAYSGPFFRYERPQGGRRRQFWQLGVEYLGITSPLADAEVIELGYRYLTDIGVPELEVLVNSLGDSECRPAYVAALRDFLRDREDTLSPDSVRLIDANPLRVLDSKADAPQLGEAPRMRDFLCQPCADHDREVRQALTRLGIPFMQEDRLVRGLDYYTRTAFEYISNGLETAQNAVGGGGRYDGLAESLGGRPTPGVGFALGLDRILLAAGGPTASHLDAFLVSETGSADALDVVSRLRRSGVRIDFDVEDRSVKAQFKEARRSGAGVVLVWRGEDALLDAQTVGGREDLSLDDLPTWLEARRR